MHGVPVPLVPNLARLVGMWLSAFCWASIDRQILYSVKRYFAPNLHAVIAIRRARDGLSGGNQRVLEGQEGNNKTVRRDR